MQLVHMAAYSYRDDPIAGFAQITGGVRLTRLRKLFRALVESQDKANGSAATFLGSRDAESYARLLSKTVDTLKTKDIRDTKWPDHDPYPALRGLVTLIALYLDKGRVEPMSKPINVVKNLFFIMSRTDFGSMFASIGASSARGRSEIARYETDPNAWVRFICEDIMGIVLGNPRGVDPDGPVIEHQVSDYGTLGTPINIPVTRRAWLTAIVRDKKD